MRILATSAAFVAAALLQWSPLLFVAPGIVAIPR